MLKPKNSTSICRKINYTGPRPFTVKLKALNKWHTVEPQFRELKMPHLANVAKTVAAQTGVDYFIVLHVFAAMCEQIGYALSNGDDVLIPGFGKFVVKLNSKWMKERKVKPAFIPAYHLRDLIRTTRTVDSVNEKQNAVYLDNSCNSKICTGNFQSTAERTQKRIASAARASGIELMERLRILRES